MSTRRHVWIVIICFGVIIAAELWYRFRNGAPFGDQSPEPAHGAGAALNRHIGDGAVSAGAVTTLQSLQPGAPQVQSPNVPSRQSPPAATLEPLPAVPASLQAAERTIDQSVARFADASIPVEKRTAEVEQLGKSGDANAVQTLMKLGDTYTYLNFKAVEALGNVNMPEVAKYLEGKTGDKDPRVVAYAIQSLAKVQGAEAVPAIAATIVANRQRPDGYQDMVCAAGVKALGEIGSSKAIPALAEEFDKTVGKTLQHEYGSQVVAAIQTIGDRAGMPALEAYAERLQVQRDGMADNPMGQRYLEGKIKEVTDAIGFIEQNGRPK